MALISNSEFLDWVQSTKLPIVKDNKSRLWFNVPAGFDIEVTSFYHNGEHRPENKRAVMYHWQFGIIDRVTGGRTWDEFQIFIVRLQEILQLNDSRRLIVYVHNLPYEFQFMRERFQWDKVFLLEDRRPVYARTGGVEFRCSLKLSGGKSLANVAKDLVSHDVKKMVGDLDYEVLRSPLTPMTLTELGYCENDIRVILAYIAEKIEQDGDITRIPLTNTGYVRNYCRKECYKRYTRYRQIMDTLTIEADEFSQLKRAFMGGHTHANAHHVRKTLTNVGSYDETSAYPANMVLEKFPMSKAHVVDGSLSDEQFAYLLKTKACLFELTLTNVRPKLQHEHPISRSKCTAIDGYILDNGRVVMADTLTTMVTEQDFVTFSKFYDWNEFSVTKFKYYDKQYLPHQFVNAILGLYQRKTVLKGVENEIVNYAISKNMMNSAYGMSVTDPVREEIEYSEGEYINKFKKMTPEQKRNYIIDAIEKYNSNKRRFLYYPWGVWITAYARRNLFTGIEALGNDYVYSDTDSLKFLNPMQHEDYFQQYNANIMRKIQAAADFHHVSVSEFSPLNRKGEPKTIGVWDFEGIYDEFKTLGAKRYLTRKGEHYEITLAGANKKQTMEFLLKTGDPFTNFDDHLTIPPEYSGRLTLTYIDTPTSGTLIDCNGVPYHYEERSSVHMEKSQYELTMSDDFIKFLKGSWDID